MSHCAFSPAAAATARSAITGLQRKCACGQSATAMSARCPQCQQAERYGPPSGLTVAPSGDIHEQEADRAAEQVMRDRAPGPRTATAPPRLQRLSSAPAMAQTPPVVQKVLRGSGAPLDAAARRFFEPRFGHDFSRVRVHHDREADAAARSVDARAFTFGRQIVFADGEYAPHTPAGRQLMAHELAHTIQQSAASRLQRKGGRGPGSCGLLDAATATVLGGAAHVQIQTRLAGRGLAVEMPIPRATKSAGVLSRACQPDGTSMGFADVARLAKPAVAISEIKPFWSAGTLGRAEAMHYRRRATHSKQRLTGTGQCGKRAPGVDDAAFSLVAGPFSAASSFDLLKGAISGTEEFGPFSLDPTRTLRAKEVGKGAIGYWCVLNKKGKKKRKKKKDAKKKDAKKKTKAKAKPKPKKPKAPKPKAPKPQGSAGAGNVGFGISIFSANVGGANAGVGVSVGSTSAAFGTAGAGVSWFSDTAAAGAAGAGVSKDSMGASAAAVGAGISDESESVGVGVAGVGTAKGSSSAATGTAGAGHAENTQSAAAGVAASGEVKDSTAAVAGATGSGKVSGVSGASSGSPKKPIDPKDVSGPDADKVPAGEQTEPVGDDAPEKAAGTEGGTVPGGQGTGSGTGSGTGAGEGKGSSGEGKGAGDTNVPPAPGASATTAEPGAPGASGTGTGTGSSTTATPQLGVMPIMPFGASDADRDKAAAEAAKVALLLRDARNPQTELLKHLADTSAGGQYMVPTSQWVEKLLNVTRDLTADDIAYIKSLDWQPGSLSEAEMRERIAKALENKDTPKAEGDKQGSGDAGKATPGAGKGSGPGTGGKAGGSKKKGAAPPGEGGKTASDSGRYTQARPFTGEIKEAYVRDYQFVTSGNPVTARSKVGDTPTMTLQWIGDDKKAYYYRLKYTVTEGPTEKTDDKNPNIRWLYFTLASTNSDIIDLAPEGQKPFLMRPGREAWYRVEKP